MAVKALACELPSRLGVPLSRLHVPDIAEDMQVIHQVLGPEEEALPSANQGAA